MVGTGLAYAKVNLSLDIKSKMPDGYHFLETVMQSVSLCDEVSVECVPGEGIFVDSGLPYLPGDERNIAAKAAAAFFLHAGISGYRTRIRITKKIPVSAGLGGGSADGACTLRVLDGMFGTGMAAETLEAIGGRVGSDVPFCITGGTKLARGRGDVMTALAPIPDCFIVACKPPFSCSTAELFGMVRCEKIRMRPDTKGMLEAIGAHDLRGMACRMYNVFEDILPRGRRDIADIKQRMHYNGALGVTMTGSGPTVIGVFDCMADAEKAVDELKKDYNECHLTHTMRTYEL